MDQGHSQEFLKGGYIAVMRAKDFGHAHFYATTPSLYSLMAIAASDMVSG